ncbi:MAG: hypothetical protein MZV70_28630 [Desulfobacterales bacterium]|nr:hypothetical protein [Desulfobacterales bacterium]
MVPGFVDGHQHFTGGGGEGGFHTRTPEMQLSMNTAQRRHHGRRGCSAPTPSPAPSRASTPRPRAFNAEGLTAFMLTGSYWHPSPTITGSVARDLVYLQPVIGCKLALSDIRGPHLEAADLARWPRTSAWLPWWPTSPASSPSHTGVKPTGLDLIFEVVRRTRHPAGHVHPHPHQPQDPAPDRAGAGAGPPGGGGRCHLHEQPARRRLAAPGRRGLRLPGGRERPVRPGRLQLGRRRLAARVERGPQPHRRDGDRHAGLAPVRTRVAGQRKGRRRLKKRSGPLTTTPARVYGLAGVKGELKAGADADILVLDPAAMTVRDVAGQRGGHDPQPCDREERVF